MTPLPKRYKARTYLTPREIQVLEHITVGLTAKEIAKRLELSPFTVQAHVRNIYQVLQVKNCAGAVAVWQNRIHTDMAANINFHQIFLDPHSPVVQWLRGSRKPRDGQCVVMQRPGLNLGTYYKGKWFDRAMNELPEPEWWSDASLYPYEMLNNGDITQHAGRNIIDGRAAGGGTQTALPDNPPDQHGGQHTKPV